MKFNFQDDKEKIRAETYLNKLRSTPTIRMVEIKAKRKKRTDDQNEWLWGCIYPMILYALINEGWEYTNVEQVHEFFKTRFTTDEVVNKHTGEVITFPSSTASMDTVTFSSYCEHLRTYALEYLDLEIPDPDKNWKENNL
mgnify:FL=1